jgi:hypothetical protein
MCFFLQTNAAAFLLTPGFYIDRRHGHANRLFFPRAKEKAPAFGRLV